MTSSTADGQGWTQVAWMVEFENGDVELWSCSDIDGTPAFGETVTPLYCPPAPEVKQE